MTAIQPHAALLAPEAPTSTEAAAELPTRTAERDVLHASAPAVKPVASQPAVAPEAVGLAPGTRVASRLPFGNPRLRPPALATTLKRTEAAMLPGAHSAAHALVEARHQQAMARAQVALQRLATGRSGADALTPIASREVAPIVAWSPASSPHPRVPRRMATVAMGRYSVASVHEQGRRAEMEDATAVAWFEDENLGVAGVFDGHGGAATANEAAELIGPVLQAHLRGIPKALRGDRATVVAAIQNAFASVDDDLRGARRFWLATNGARGIAPQRSPLPTLHGILRRSHLAAMAQATADKAHFIGGTGSFPHAAVLQAARQSGSSAVVAVFWQGALYIANLGDSRAVLVRNDGTAWRLSKDQKPEDEVAQVQARGGTVAFVEGAHRVDRSVAMARALGDYTLAVGRRPQVTPVDLEDAGHCALMLGCDGVFDCIHDDVHAAYIYEKVQAGVPPERIASDLVNASYARYSRDNMSMLLIPLAPNG